mgnify:CR=1 FL=1|jgi:predicted nucleic acid-binding protein
MKLVIDANVVISALIADSKTRELIVTLEPDLLTPAFVHDEIGNYEDLIVEKSGMEPQRVQQFIDLLFQYIEVVPVDEFYPYIEQADAAIGETDPDDVLYVACALASDAGIWSDDSDFDEQDVVERAELTIQQLKVTLLVDTKVNAILDLHVTTTRKHDSQITPSLIKRNPENIDVLLGDKGYDDQKIRRLARQYEVRPLIKHREFAPLHKA